MEGLSPDFQIPFLLYAQVFHQLLSELFLALQEQGPTAKNLNHALSYYLVIYVLNQCRFLS